MLRSDSGVFSRSLVENVSTSAGTWGALVGASPPCISCALDFAVRAVRVASVFMDSASESESWASRYSQPIAPVHALL